MSPCLPRERPRAAADARNHGQSVARLLRNRQFIATDAVGFCVLFTQVAMFTYVTFHLSEPPFGLSTAALGWLFVVYLLGAAVTPVAGRWIDARGHRAGLAAGVAIGIAGAVMTLVPWLPAIVAGLALVATGVFVSQATASSYIGQWHGGRSRPGGRAVLVLLLRRRQSRRRAPGPLLDDGRLDGLRRSRRRRAARHDDSCVEILDPSGEGGPMPETAL